MSAQPSTATKNPTAQVGPEPLTSTPCSPKSDSNSKAMDSLLATFASYKSKILASPINTPTSTTANSTPISPYPSPFPCQTSNTNPDSDSIVTRRISITLLPMKVPILKMPVPRKRKSGVSVAQATPVPGPVLYSTPTPAAATENLSRIERKNSPARRASVIVPRVRHSSQVAILETCDDDSASDVESSQDDEDADQEAEFETEQQQQQQNAERNRRRRFQERGVLTVFPGFRHDSYVAVVESCSPLVGDFRERDGHFLLQEAEDKNDAGWRGEIVEDVVSEYPPTRYQPWAQGPELSTRNPGEKSVSDSADRLVNWDEGVSPRSLDIVSEMSRTWKSVEKPGKAATVFKTETGERTKSVSDYSSSLPGTPGTFPLQGKEFFGGEAEPVSLSMIRGSHLRDSIGGRGVFNDLELGEMDACWES
ncbi:hypothetical protein BKA65DRAFT_568132 [Rhexocercosporidium sp. MPI-PUGE-AT-0058]|nr:hypothetical protein BKA65DRAFT_568132 [Rhexocercosporidium sp. MPI-PUGE-AT-0058]